MDRYFRAQWQRFFGLNVSQIDPLLFVGGQFRAEQWPDLHALGIRAVLSLQAEHEDRFSEPLPTQTLRLLVDDHTAPSLAQLEQAVAFITAAHRALFPVFVHCHAGLGRAPTTAAAYLAAQRGLSADAAMEVVRQARPIITPNPAQLAQLRAFVAQHS